MNKQKKQQQQDDITGSINSLHFFIQNIEGGIL